MRIWTIIYLLILFIFPGFKAFSQESIFDEVSYIYLEKLIAVAKENNPQSKISTTQIGIAETNVKRAKLSWLDPLSVSYYIRGNGGYDIINPYINNGYQVGLTINPVALLQKSLNVKTAKEQVVLAELNAKQTEITLEARVRTLYFSFLQQSIGLKWISKAHLENESIYKLAKLKYERSEISFELYTAALQSFSSSFSNKIKAEADMLTAKLALEEVIGKKLETVK